MSDRSSARGRDWRPNQAVAGGGRAGRRCVDRRHRGPAKPWAMVPATRGIAQRPIGVTIDGRPHPLDVGLEGVDVLDQRRGARRGCLQRAVGDLVGDAAIDLVTKAGEDRQRRHGDRGGDRLVVERRQVGFRAAAADQHDDIEIVVSRQCAQAPTPCRRPTRPAPARRPPAGGRQGHCVEFVGEVGPGGAGRAGDHADSQRSSGTRVRRLASNKPLATSRRTTSSRSNAISPNVNRGSRPLIFSRAGPTGRSSRDGRRSAPSARRRAAAGAC